MNKNLLITGVFAVAGFGLMAFFGPTKADQMKEIEAKVKTGLEEFRAAEKAKCDARVEEEVAAKLAAMTTEEPAPTLTTATPTKKGTKGGPKAQPLTPATPPKSTPGAPDVKTRGGAVQEGTNDVKTRGGAVQQGTQDVKTRGGAVKQGGGGK